MKLWGRLFHGEKSFQSKTVSCAHWQEGLHELCQAFDVPRPIVLGKHERATGPCCRSCRRKIRGKPLCTGAAATRLPPPSLRWSACQASDTAGAGVCAAPRRRRSPRPWTPGLGRITFGESDYRLGHGHRPFSTFKGRRGSVPGAGFPYKFRPRNGRFGNSTPAGGQTPGSPPGDSRPKPAR